MAVTLCDSCKTTSARLFCKADSAYLCIPCDGKVHAANKLASRHERVRMCEACERAPASVTCKADAAALCATCDRDIHSANPLARRHERFPVVPFNVNEQINGGDHHLLDPDVNVAKSEAEEAEAALWLLPNPNLNTINKIAGGSDDDNLKLKVTEHPDPEPQSEYLFNDIDPYLGIDLKTPDQKLHQILMFPNAFTSLTPSMAYSRTQSKGLYEKCTCDSSSSPSPGECRRNPKLSQHPETHRSVSEL